jgi:hypothetical protein
MGEQLRKLRGVICISLTWGILWAAIFAALAIVAGVIDPDSIDPGEGPIRVSAIGATIGLVAGVAFGILLSLAESGRPIRNIWLTRAAMWGILGSAVFPLVSGRYDQVFVMCPIGAVVAMASVATARKAALQDSRQPRRLRDLFFACLLTPVRDAVNPSKEPSV